MTHGTAQTGLRIDTVSEQGAFRPLQGTQHRTFPDARTHPQREAPASQTMTRINSHSPHRVYTRTRPCGFMENVPDDGNLRHSNQRHDP